MTDDWQPDYPMGLSDKAFTNQVSPDCELPGLARGSRWPAATNVTLSWA